jgi:hypothetical protein
LESKEEDSRIMRRKSSITQEYSPGMVGPLRAADHATWNNQGLGIMYKLFSDAKFRKKVVELCRSADLWDFDTVRLYEMLRRETGWTK